MKYSEVSSRYAQALFELSGEVGNRDKVFSDIRSIGAMIAQNEDIREFLSSKMIQSEEKKKILEQAFKNNGACKEVENFVFTLAQKGRVELLPEIALAYEARSDEANGVTRGEVRSSTVLTSEERARIESKVSEVTKKKVILTYKEDPEVIGGLIAEVGGYRFDDTLRSHLKRLKDDINRSAH